MNKTEWMNNLRVFKV